MPHSGLPPTIERPSVLRGGPLHDMVLRALYDDAGRGVAMTNLDFRLRHCNAAFARLLGYTDEELIGRPINDLTHPEDRQIGRDALRELVQGERPRAAIEKRYVRKDGGEVWAALDIQVIRDDSGAPLLFVTSIEDITPRKRAEAERLAAQERVIEAQREALRQLSTPVIPIAAGILAAPLIGAVDSERAQQIVETLLAEIAAQRAHTVILDITGAAAVDAEAIALFGRIAQAARLLGAAMVLTGVSPAVAQAMVGLDVPLQGVRTLGSFQRGVAAALAGELGAMR
jgi:rsbT co-antagonist protein RsbR